MTTFAIILTCHNRKELTLKCLAKAIELKSSASIFIVDDGSSDGTSEEIKKMFPKVNVIKGSGNLYWTRGMHLAWKEASKYDFDFYIWLNDDVVLFENAFKELFECSQKKDDNAIITGIIIDELNKKTLYGGYDKNRKLLKPNSRMQLINYMNGNVVLVPKKVFQILGNLDPFYHHDLGDVDFGLRALQKNIFIFTTKVAIGYGKENKINRERLMGTNIRKRFSVLYSPLGSNPFKNLYFRNRHFGLINAISYFFFQHFLNIISDKLLFFFRFNKYIR